MYKIKDLKLNPDNNLNIISILEIQGIKFTSRNFQIEIELKQVMVLNNEPLFNNCLIKTTKPKFVNENKDDNNSLERNNTLGSIQKDKTK